MMREDEKRVEKKEENRKKGGDGNLVIFKG